MTVAFSQEKVVSNLHGAFRHLTTTPFGWQWCPVTAHLLLASSLPPPSYSRANKMLFLLPSSPILLIPELWASSSHRPPRIRAPTGPSVRSGWSSSLPQTTWPSQASAMFAQPGVKSSLLPWSTLISHDCAAWRGRSSWSSLEVVVSPLLWWAV